MLYVLVIVSKYFYVSSYNFYKKIEDKKIKKLKLDNLRTKLRNDLKNDFSKRFLEKEYKKFIKNCNNIPVKLQKKLKKMPNNMAYVWNNVHHYGHLKCNRNKNDIIIYEKKYNILYTHFYKYRDGVRVYKIQEKILYKIN